MHGRNAFLLASGTRLPWLLTTAALLLIALAC